LRRRDHAVQGPAGRVVCGEPGSVDVSVQHPGNSLGGLDSRVGYRLACLPRITCAAGRARGRGWSSGRFPSSPAVTPADRYSQVARLHMRCLDRSFLATLGEAFLTLMYEAIDQAEQSILLVEEQRGEVRGFITGGTGMRAIYGR